MSDFSVGQQPCGAFEGVREFYGLTVHQCYGPFDDKTVERCGTTRDGWVSFCQNCHHDHHDGGWDVCGQPREETP